VRSAVSQKGKDARKPAAPSRGRHGRLVGTLAGDRLCLIAPMVAGLARLDLAQRPYFDYFLPLEIDAESWDLCQMGR
jgi:hypothetical protein